MPIIRRLRIHWIHWYQIVITNSNSWPTNTKNTWTPRPRRQGDWKTNQQASPFCILLPEHHSTTQLCGIIWYRNKRSRSHVLTNRRPTTLDGYQNIRIIKHNKILHHIDVSRLLLDILYILYITSHILYISYHIYYIYLLFFWLFVKMLSL